MQQAVTIVPPRSRFRAALYGLAPGIAMIAIAMGFRLDPRSASAFSGQPAEHAQFSAHAGPSTTTGVSSTTNTTSHAYGTLDQATQRPAGTAD